MKTFNLIEETAKYIGKQTVRERLTIDEPCCDSIVQQVNSE